MKTPLLLLTTLLFACGSSTEPVPAEGTTGGASGAASAPAEADGKLFSEETADGGLRISQTTGEGRAPGQRAGQSAGPRFVTPEGWKEEAPESGMRFKQYSLAGPEGSEPALVVVALWRGGIGGLERNLDRWVSQVGSEKAAADLSASERWTTETDDYLVTHVYVEGAIQPMEGMGKDIVATDAGAILAAYIEPTGSSDVWTIKMTGPSKTVAAHKERYDAFVAGL